ncbi:MAG: ABC transporter permease [Anaerolineaceae bacterium]
MNIWMGVIEAFHSILGNKLRSALTILGIVIGVAAVIAMLSVGKGAQSSISSSINSIGSNMIFVMPGNQQEDVRNARPLTMADARALEDKLAAPSIGAVAPVVSTNAVVSFAGEKKTTSIDGITVDYQFVRNQEVQLGEYINNDHVLSNASVTVIGPEIATKLFGSEAAGLDQTLRIDGQPFRVIGILTAKGGSAFGSEDNQVLIPLTTARSRLIHRSNPEQLDVIFVSAASAEVVTQAQEEIKEILRTRHRINLNPDDFTIMSQEDILATTSSITGILTIFLGGVAGISLLVGGIGIMNIMLVSVVERTREIGLRKALGARKKDILLQFLTESSILSLLGGVLGIMLGWLIAFAIGQIAAASGTEFSAIVGIDSILIATIFSTVVGLFFGIYPASRAANLQPVEALRSE